MNHQCSQCGERYGVEDGCYQGVPKDRDWSAGDGRCYACYLNFLLEMYGGWMEPVIKLHGNVYFGDGGKVTAEEMAHD